MNNILKLQNEPENIKLLAAQREMYSSAKWVYALQFLISILIPVIAAVIFLFKPEWAVYGAIYGIVLLIMDEIVFNPAISKLKEKAASTQEQFDCSVFGINRSDLKVQSKVTTEDILNYYNEHIKIKDNIEKLKDWYGKDIGELSNGYIATLICQRSNCWWDLKLRKRYKDFVTIILVLVPTIIVVAGVVKDLKLAELMLILSMLIPFFLFLLKELSENSNANKRLEHLYSFFEEIFRKLEDKSLNTELISKQLRSIQDEIFESRTCSPLVPEWIYKRFRSIDSSEMDRVILELIEKMKRVETLQ